MGSLALGADRLQRAAPTSAMATIAARTMGTDGSSLAFSSGSGDFMTTSW
ncbi:MAG TPA: hypothetical protein VLA79_18440 [Polyangia bacterium]|nr:hypothetical protein [Polyangia bacterium]